MIFISGCLHSFLTLVLIFIIKISSHIQYKSCKYIKETQLCLICIVNTIRIQLFKFKSIIFNTHLKKILNNNEFFNNVLHIFRSMPNFFWKCPTVLEISIFFCKCLTRLGNTQLLLEMFYFLEMSNLF